MYMPDSSGKPTAAMTPHAKDWLSTLEGINEDQLKFGLKSLATRENAGFPPTSGEFSKLCLLHGWEDAIDEICDYFNESDYQWKSDTAYNLFLKLRINKQSEEKLASIIKRAKSLYPFLEREKFTAAPKQIEPPAEQPEPPHNYKAFQAKMFSAITEYNLDLWVSTEFHQKLKALFTPAGTDKVMKTWEGKNRPPLITVIDDFAKISSFPPSDEKCSTFADFAKKVASQAEGLEK
jgi:hypothetical protein